MPANGLSWAKIPFVCRRVLFQLIQDSILVHIKIVCLRHDAVISAGPTENHSAAWELTKRILIRQPTLLRSSIAPCHSCQRLNLKTCHEPGAFQLRADRLSTQRADGAKAALNCIAKRFPLCRSSWNASASVILCYCRIKYVISIGGAMLPFWMLYHV